MRVLVKVQLPPVDRELSVKTGKLYVDTRDPNVFVYDQKRTHVFQGRDDKLRKFMLDAARGVGYMKGISAGRVGTARAGRSTTRRRIPAAGGMVMSERLGDAPIEPEYAEQMKARGRCTRPHVQR